MSPSPGMSHSGSRGEHPHGVGVEAVAYYQPPDRACVTCGAPLGTLIVSTEDRPGHWIQIRIQEPDKCIFNLIAEEVSRLEQEAEEEMEEASKV